MCPSSEQGSNHENVELALYLKATPLVLKSRWRKQPPRGRAGGRGGEEESESTLYRQVSCFRCSAPQSAGSPLESCAWQPAFGQPSAETGTCSQLHKSDVAMRP